MKNYFKKFSIMFMMLLTIIGTGMIQNGIMANAAATVGQQLNQPESGWRRCLDNNNLIKYKGAWISYTADPNYTDSQYHYSLSGKYSFKFHGTKFRLISLLNSSYSSNISVYINGIKVDSFYEDTASSDQKYKALVFEKDLPLGEYVVEVINNIPGKYMGLDAIDIDDSGYLMPYEESIDIDKSSMNLTVEQAQQLKVVTTPSAVEVTWKSSDESIATIEQRTGKITNVTGAKEGTCIITATTEDALIATCTVNVTKKDNSKPNNDNPTQPTGGENLYIQLVNGDVKKYAVTNDEFDKFKHWYQDRVDNKAGTPFYEFDKDGNKDYVVLDKIEWFEIRK